MNKFMGFHRDRDHAKHVIFTYSCPQCNKTLACLGLDMFIGKEEALPRDIEQS